MEDTFKQFSGKVSTPDGVHLKVPGGVTLGPRPTQRMGQNLVMPECALPVKTTGKFVKGK